MRCLPGPNQPVRALISCIANQLETAKIPAPRRDANLLLQLALGKDEPLLTHQQVHLDKAHCERLDHFIAQRLAGCPVSRLRGSREFYSLLFEINEATLDPRPDSETVVEAAIAACGTRALRVADFGTGSGCLLIAMLAHCPRATGIGLDLSAAAIEMASQNARRHALDERVQFRVSDWDASLAPDKQFDIIISNPPYIARTDAPTLAPEVRLYDPELALYGGDDGLDAYRRLLPIVAARLADQGCALIEIGQGQEEAVEEIALAQGLRLAEHLRDLAGIIRCLKFVK